MAVVVSRTRRQPCGCSCFKDEHAAMWLYLFQRQGGSHVAVVVSRTRRQPCGCSCFKDKEAAMWL